LQKLKIIPKDIDPIAVDLTDSPPPSPRVKQERGVHGFGQEKDEHSAKDTKIKREPGVDHSSSQIPGQTPARLAPHWDQPRMSAARSARHWRTSSKSSSSSRRDCDAPKPWQRWRAATERLSNTSILEYRSQRPTTATRNARSKPVSRSASHLGDQNKKRKRKPYKNDNKTQHPQHWKHRLDSRGAKVSRPFIHCGERIGKQTRKPHPKQPQKHNTPAL
jgi:hypothetical protein